MSPLRKSALPKNDRFVTKTHSTNSLNNEYTHVVAVVVEQQMASSFASSSWIKIQKQTAKSPLSLPLTPLSVPPSSMNPHPMAAKSPPSYQVATPTSYYHLTQVATPMPGYYLTRYSSIMWYCLSETATRSSESNFPVTVRIFCTESGSWAMYDRKSTKENLVPTYIM